jgi:seryl-tRNA synthetase
VLDLKWIRENPADFDAGLARRGLEPMSGAVLELDEKRRENATRLQEAQARRNAASKEIGKHKGKGGDPAKADALMAEVAALKDAIAQGEERERDIEKELRDLLAGIPNIPLADVPDGRNEHDNVKVREWGEPRAFDFTPKPHYELGDALGLMDFEGAARMSGARFTVLKGGLARLSRALGQFMLDLHTQEAHRTQSGVEIGGYTEVNPPLLVKDQAAYGTAQMPKFEDDLFRAPFADQEAFEERLKEFIQEFDFGQNYLAKKAKTIHGVTYDEAVQLEIKALQYGWSPYRYFLIPTAEVSLTNLVREQILPESDLPLRFTALTPCFRAEAGAAGKDTRGMIRQHQFEKVELVSITTPEQALAEHERMTGAAEEVLRRLELPYRTMLLCTGDMGFASRKTYDIEVWLPGAPRDDGGVGAYREISSCSVCGDFQARRMEARYRPATPKAKPEYVHTLNGSGLAVGRTLIAVMENYQEADGSIRVPDVLQPYMGGITRIG